MNFNNLLNVAGNLLHMGEIKDNVYYDQSNYEKDQYQVERIAKQTIPFNTLTLGASNIAFNINNAYLVDRVVGMVSLHGVTGVTERLPAERIIKKVRYQIGNSNQEEQSREHALLSKMSQCDSLEKRDSYILNAEFGGVSITTSAVKYYFVLNLPWSKLTRRKKLPIDMRLLTQNMIIYIDLAPATEIYSSGGSGVTTLADGYLQPIYHKMVDNNEGKKLIAINQEGQTVPQIYAYPIIYEKNYSQVISSTGAQSIKLDSFISGRLYSISFFFINAWPKGEKLTDISLTYNADILSRYDGDSYDQIANMEKNCPDQYTVNSVKSYIYEIPLGQDHVYNKNEDAYKYGPNFLSQTLFLNFTNSATGTLYWIYNYQKFIAFDGLTANII